MATVEVGGCHTRVGKVVIGRYGEEQWLVYYFTRLLHSLVLI